MVIIPFTLGIRGYFLGGDHGPVARARNRILLCLGGLYISGVIFLFPDYNLSSDFKRGSWKESLWSKLLSGIALVANKSLYSTSKLNILSRMEVKGWYEKIIYCFDFSISHVWLLIWTSLLAVLPASWSAHPWKQVLHYLRVSNALIQNFSLHYILIFQKHKRCMKDKVKRSKENHKSWCLACGVP